VKVFIEVITHRKPLAATKNHITLRICIFISKLSKMAAQVGEAIIIQKPSLYPKTRSRHRRRREVNVTTKRCPFAKLKGERGGWKLGVCAPLYSFSLCILCTCSSLKPTNSAVIPVPATSASVYTYSPSGAASEARSPEISCFFYMGVLDYMMWHIPPHILPTPTLYRISPKETSIIFHLFCRDFLRAVSEVLYLT
jgi:hypothetical protein